MCGIFGSVGEPLGPEGVARVQAVLDHRGPDAHGAAELPGATLVHTRLRVIDLSEAAAQPLCNEDRTVWATFNGEIYNFQVLRQELESLGHRFRSHSDTEVIVHGYEQWGDDVVARLDGMFAFGVWDVSRRRLLLARDRTGKKPLFYGQSGGRFFFGSEIKALFAAGFPMATRPEGVLGMLAYGYTPAPATVYRAIEQLPPAHRLVVEGGAPRAPERYWAPSFVPFERAPDEAEAARTVRALLTDAVKKRLVADVPVGAFLSGGVDSTIVVGLMAQQCAKVRTFSIGFSGDPRFDETAYARLAARAFGTEHVEFQVTPADFELVERLVWHHDGPFGDSSAIPTFVVSRLTRAEVTVALTGDGGDEVFAGYLRLLAAAASERIPGPLRRLAGASRGLLPTGTGPKSLPARARRFLAALERPIGDRLAAWISFFAFSLEDVIQPEHLSHLAPVLDFHRSFFADAESARLTPLAAVLRCNLHSYLPYDLLVKADRTSMAHGLETRSPFLDTALMEYACRLPDRFKARGRTTKYILRKAFSDILPPAIDRRGKMGFGLPLGTWFRGALRDYVHDLLVAQGARLSEWLRPEAVARLVKDHDEKRADNEQLIWLLLTFEIWLRQMPRLANAFSPAAAETAWGAAELCSARTIAGGYGNP